MADKVSLPNDEARIAALLRATGIDAPPPDQALLADLRQRTIEALQDHVESASAGVPESGIEVSADKATSLSYERRPMLSLMMRAAVALAAVVLIGVFAFNPWTARTVS